MNIKEAMTRGPQITSADATLYSALRMMQFGGFSHLPVYDGDHLVGMLRWSDIERFLAQTPDPATLLSPPGAASAPRVRLAMRYQLTTVSEETSLEDGVRRMLSEEEDCLVILDGGGQLAGVLTRSDALRVLLERDRQASLPSYSTSHSAPDLSA